MQELRRALTTPALSPSAQIGTQKPLRQTLFGLSHLAQRAGDGAAAPQPRPRVRRQSNQGAHINGQGSSSAEASSTQPHPHVQRAGGSFALYERSSSGASAALQPSSSNASSTASRPLPAEEGFRVQPQRQRDARGGAAPSWATTLIGPGSLRANIEALVGMQNVAQEQYAH